MFRERSRHPHTPWFNPVDPLMDAVYIFFCMLLALVAVLASIAVWAPRPARLRAVAVALVAGFIPLGYLTLTEILSQPKPMTHEWFKGHVDEATV